MTRGPLPRLHAITDERIARRADLEDVARQLATGGGAELALHARGHALSGLESYDLADRLSAYPPTRLFVNDRLDVALAMRRGGGGGAQGVQLRMDGLTPADARRLDPDWWIGVSVHDLAEAGAAQAAGADYLLVGPVYRTATHPERAPLGAERLAAVVQLGLPVIAIGGVTPDRMPAIRATGAYGVAAIQALWDADDPADAARRVLRGLLG